MSTNILIPAYNEGTTKSELYLEQANKTLREKGYTKQFVDSCRSNIFRTLAVLVRETSLPITVIDDGSSDDTAEEVKRFQTRNKNHQVSLLSHNANKGK